MRQRYPGHPIIKGREYKNGGGFVASTVKIQDPHKTRIEKNAGVFDLVTIRGEAEVRDDAVVCDKVTINYGGAEIYGSSLVYDNVELGGGVKIYGNAEIYGDVILSGVRVHGNTEICGKLTISGNIEIASGIYYSPERVEVKSKKELLPFKCKDRKDLEARKNNEKD